ncbi:hypothetical protein CARUB_v10021800mg [Capsella rubella]|uniref:FKB95-like N-terminal Kelch domain-containing protein n=1 Tax=Capsella rubella TaxID=81985 RepID=R0I848_9BRAS|nr:hypothetical protein CARUB_v10021800mg [Capsella rubella]
MSTKKKKPSPTSKSITNPSLPYDLLLSCIARVSRLYYPTLSLFYPSKNPSWFRLCRKPDQTLTNDSSKKNMLRGYVLVLVPILNYHPASSMSLVAVGSNIYDIGDSNPMNSSSVWIMDCWSHTWRQGPSLRVKLQSYTASVLDQKIYLAGCYNDGDSKYLKHSCEVFDTLTQTWDPQPIPCSEINLGES